jgi:hypothetical protein
LELDAPTVQDLIDDLSARRRHLNTGVPIEQGSPASWTWLAAVMWDLRHLLGVAQPYDEPRPMTARLPVAVALRLDEGTAQEFHDALYEVGERRAAGAPIASAGDESERRLDSIVRQLRERAPECA